MQIYSISSGMLSTNNARLINTKQSQPIKPQSSEVSFTGSKKTLFAGITSGIILGYYATVAAVAPPVIIQGANNEYIRGFEYQAAQASADLLTNEEKEKLISETLNRTTIHPEDNITKGCIKILDKYSILDEKDKVKLEATIKEMLEKGNLDKKSEDFYTGYLNNLRNN